MPLAIVFAILLLVDVFPWALAVYGATILAYGLWPVVRGQKPFHDGVADLRILALGQIQRAFCSPPRKAARANKKLKFGRPGTTLAD